MGSRIITLQFVQNIIEKRRREIHKGDCGRILIVAGSEGMAGAAILACRGALRAGSGLVQAALSENLFPIVQAGVPEATCLKRDFSLIDPSRYDAAAAGPGLGEKEDGVRSVISVLERFDSTVVLDADGLNIVAHRDLFDIVRARPNGKTIITPHNGEAERLLGFKPGNSAEERQKAALMLAEKTGAITVLKGHQTVVATAEGKTYTNTTGNPGMATAGSGDVLTGIITGLAGQKKPSGERLSAEEAAVCGVFVHGMAGDLAAEETGEYGLIAGDIAYYTAIALKHISG